MALSNNVHLTLNDLQGHSLIANLLRWNFSYSCAAADKITIQLTWRIARSLCW